MSLAFRAGISETDFWQMTAHNVIIAYIASQENISRLAYRTAVMTRMSHKHFPKTEDALFSKAMKPKPRQTVREQYLMARAITKVLH